MGRRDALPRILSRPWMGFRRGRPLMPDAPKASRAAKGGRIRTPRRLPRHHIMVRCPHEYLGEDKEILPGHALPVRHMRLRLPRGLLPPREAQCHLLPGLPQEVLNRPHGWVIGEAETAGRWSEPGAQQGTGPVPEAASFQPMGFKAGSGSGDPGQRLVR